MAEARSHAQWNHTAALLALIANCHRDPHRRKAYEPADFLPGRAGQGEALPAADVSVLKSVFVDRQPLDHLRKVQR
jgi:hypothetical protein